jgi:hypothetical protein
VVRSVAAWVALLDPGLVQGLVIAVSYTHGRDDHEAALAHFSTAFFALLAVAVVAVPSLLAPFISWGRSFDIPAPMTSIGTAAWFGVALRLAAPALPVALVRQVYAGYQRACVGSAFTTGARSCPSPFSRSRPARAGLDTVTGYDLLIRLLSR